MRKHIVTKFQTSVDKESLKREETKPMEKWKAVCSPLYHQGSQWKNETTVNSRTNKLHRKGIESEYIMKLRREQYIILNIIIM